MSDTLGHGVSLHLYLLAGLATLVSVAIDHLAHKPYVRKPDDYAHFDLGAVPGRHSHLFEPAKVVAFACVVALIVEGVFDRWSLEKGFYFMLAGLAGYLMLSVFGAHLKRLADKSAVRRMAKSTELSFCRKELHVKYTLKCEAAVGPGFDPIAADPEILGLRVKVIEQIKEEMEEAGKLLRLYGAAMFFVSIAVWVLVGGILFHSS